MTSDFASMKAKGARTVITFDICGDGKSASFYERTWIIFTAPDMSLTITVRKLQMPFPPQGMQAFLSSLSLGLCIILASSFAGDSIPRMQRRDERTSVHKYRF